MEDRRNIPGIDTLEEQAMQGSGEAAMELARRYDQGCDGAEQDPNMADYWREQAAELGYQQPQQGEEPPAPLPDPPQNSQSQDELYERWNASYRDGRYETMLSRQLQQAETAGDPYAAFVLARRYLNSESKADRDEALPVLEHARTLLEGRVAATRDASACALLVRVLDQLGQLYATDKADANQLQKAYDCFINARELDETDYEGLLWFYNGPAKKLPRFRADPAELERARFELSELQAGKQGIAGRLAFALSCRKEGRNLKAQDWLQMALGAPDADARPDLCAVTRYYQAEMNGSAPDLEALKAVADQSSWACLLLGTRSKTDEERLGWYTQGAGLEGEPEMRERCRQKQERLQTQLAEKQQAEEEARRQAAAQKEAQLRKRQEEDARFSKWYNAYRSGEDDNALGIDLQQQMKEGDPYAAFVLARQYLKSNTAKERAQALPVLEQSRTLLETRLKMAENDSAAQSVLVRVLIQLVQLYLQGDKPRVAEAEKCLVRAWKMDETQLDRLVDFYERYGSQLPNYQKDPEALELRVNTMGQEAARKGGILPRLRYALHCHRQEQAVAAAEWLKMALQAPDAAQNQALVAIAQYYQAVFAGQEADTRKLEGLAPTSSWICLILGELAQDEKTRMGYYKKGAALDPALEGAASMAGLCAERYRALQQRREEQQRQEAEARAAAEKEAAAQRKRQQEHQQFLDWAQEYSRGSYDEMLASGLQQLVKEGNPYAALVMARRYLQSDSAADRSEAIPLLEKAQKLTEQRRSVAQTQADRLLLDILLLLGGQYAAQGSEASLRKAQELLQSAAKLDVAGRRALLRFYTGPARRMQSYTGNPAKLQALCAELYEQEAQDGGIVPRLRFAVFCMEQGRKVKAQDWIRLARQAPDAADHPRLDEVVRFYLALASGQAPDNLEAMRKAANSGCSWACLALGDQADQEEEKLRWYRKGAELDPRAEGDASQVEACTAKRDEIFRRRAAAYNADLNRRKAEKAETARKKEKASQRAAQRSWVTLFGLLYGATMVVVAILCLLTHVTGSDFWLTIGRAMSSLWTLGCMGGLVAYFLGMRPGPYQKEPLRLLYTLLIALVISMTVPTVVQSIFL